MSTYLETMSLSVKFFGWIFDTSRPSGKGLGWVRLHYPLFHRSRKKDGNLRTKKTFETMHIFTAAYRANVGFLKTFLGGHLLFGPVQLQWGQLQPR